MGLDIPKPIINSNQAYSSEFRASMNQGSPLADGATWWRRPELRCAELSCAAIPFPAQRGHKRFGEKTIPNVPWLRWQVATGALHFVATDGAGRRGGKRGKNWTRKIIDDMFQVKFVSLITDNNFFLQTRKYSHEHSKLFWKHILLGVSLCLIQAYSSSPHIPNKSFAFY